MSLIPPSYMNTVVAIGYRQEQEIHWAASGFFYAKAVQAQDKERELQAFLVSTCHVLSGRQEVFLRLNPQGKEEAIIGAGRFVRWP